MMNLSSIKSPSELIKARSKAMWVTKYDSGQHTISFRVVPHGKKFGHKTRDRRLVLFDSKRQIAECLSLETGEVCPANSFGKLCSHVLAASKRLSRKAA